jgi:CheY-like chemotaxis protein
MNLFSEHQPDVVITDWTMPDISGLELFQQIRSQSEQTYSYLILVSANADKDEVLQGFAAGADARSRALGPRPWYCLHCRREVPVRAAIAVSVTKNGKFVGYLHQYLSCQVERRAFGLRIWNVAEGFYLASHES